MPPASADVTITIRGVSDPLRNNVLAYLSFARYRRSKDLTSDTVERLQSRIGREVQSALRPFGYFEPKVRSTVTASKPGKWQVRITIDPGQPVILTKVDVRVVGPGASSPLFTRITSKLPFHAGEPLNQAEYDGVKSDLLRTAATYGFLDATLTRHELLVDPAKHTASIALELATGVRYHFGATTIEQHAVREKLVRRYLRYRQGDPFDLTEVLRTQFALDDSEYFSDLAVLTGAPDRAQHTIPISIRADPSRPNVYSFAGGYETDTGARGILSWEDRRLNSYGHKMSVDLEAAQVTKYSLQSRYVIPIGDPAVENLTLAGTVEQQQLADVDARTDSVGPSLTRVTGRWQTVWFVNGVHATGTVQGAPECPVTANGISAYVQCETPAGQPISTITAGTATNDLLVPGVDIASVPKGYLGEPMFEHGFFAEIRGSQGAFGSKANFLQLHVQLERVFKLSPKWYLLLRDEVGATVASHFDEMPSVMRFFAGGEGSVRGFAYNDLSPTQNFCETVPSNGSSRQECVLDQKAGGKDLFTGSVEFDRDLPRKLGIAVFFDYGNAFNHLGPQRQAIITAQGQIQLIREPLLQYGAGVGFRFRLPVLTLGIDLAQPLSQSGGPRLYINFSPKL
ncbi:MAG: autotransporter assembly complex protein TamA [Steroidobacteraceae bacterium]